jgi:hypothetical protein
MPRFNRRRFQIRQSMVIAPCEEGQPWRAKRTGSAHTPCLPATNETSTLSFSAKYDLQVAGSRRSQIYRGPPEGNQKTSLPLSY